MIILVLLVAAAVWLAPRLGALFSNPTPTPTVETRPATNAAAGTWYDVYFTDPGSGETASGPDRALVEAIGKATTSVDMAIYSLSLPSVQEALTAASQRGVAVRLVMDSDNRDDPVPLAIEAVGIPILGDRREGLMHNKFVIIDRQEVWTGSTNLTRSSIVADHNNLIRIRSTEVAADYTTEFEEMFVGDEFGPSSPANTPYPSVSIGGTQVEVYFSPDDGVSDHLAALISQAGTSINFLAYSFTSDPLAEAMHQRAAAGVVVNGVFDESQYFSNTGTEFDRFRESGIDVRVDANPGLMHHKVIILDESIVVTGSYNFSANAEERNDENVIILYSPEIAAQYVQEFRKIFDQAE
jgi:phosphatidylserine/phosphatidylglycerophosphate/cardiolipin synthase-like enzyme